MKKLDVLAKKFNSTGLDSSDRKQDYIPSMVSCEDGYCIVGDCTCDCPSGYVTRK